MANRWGNSGNVADFMFLGSKITADGDFSYEIKRRLLLGRKVMSNIDSILKSRDITLSTRVSPVKAMAFPVVMYGCERWTIKKAEREKDMAPHSSVLAWEIPWTEEPGGVTVHGVAKESDRT